MESDERSDALEEAMERRRMLKRYFDSLSSDSAFRREYAKPKPKDRRKTWYQKSSDIYRKYWLYLWKVIIYREHTNKYLKGKNNSFLSIAFLCSLPSQRLDSSSWKFCSKLVVSFPILSSGNFIRRQWNSTLIFSLK